MTILSKNAIIYITLQRTFVCFGRISEGLNEGNIMKQFWKRMAAGLLSAVCGLSWSTILSVSAADAESTGSTMDICFVDIDGQPFQEMPEVWVSISAFPTDEEAVGADTWNIDENPICRYALNREQPSLPLLENVHDGWEYQICLESVKYYEPVDATDMNAWGLFVQDLHLFDETGREYYNSIRCEDMYTPVECTAVYVYPDRERGDSLTLTIQLQQQLFDNSEAKEREGECGENLRWEYDNMGTLTISGTGDMWDRDSYYGYLSRLNLWQDFQYMIQNVIIEEGCTSIGDHMFRDHMYIRSVKLPSTLKTIGDYAFEGCDCITSLVLPESLETVGRYAFSNLNADIPSHSYGVLRTVTINDGCREIGDYAFAGNVHLQELDLPDSVESIGHGAFEECQILRTVKLPNGLEDLPNFAFSGCELLNSIDFGSSLRSIGYNAFTGCRSLKEVILPETLVHLGEFAFEDCTGLTSAVIGAKLRELPIACFDGCINLTTVTIGEGLQSICEYCFRGCTALTTVNAPDTLMHIEYPAFPDANPDFFKSFSDGMVVIGGTLYLCLNDNSVVTIPEGVKSISSYAFARKDDKEVQRNNTISQLTLPKTMINLDDHALSEMYMLTDVTFGNEDLDFTYKSFENCSWLWNNSEDFVILGTSLLGYHGRETLIQIPEGVTRICGKFADTVELSTVTCPSTLKSIECYAFENQMKLFEVNLNEGLEYIGEYAFSGTKRLLSMRFPASLLEIDANAVARSENATFSSGLTTIYGAESSEAEYFAEINQLEFVSTGEAEQHGIDKTLVIGKDTFGFGNCSEYLANAELSEEQISYISENLARNRDLDLEAPWNGSCYGFSVLTVLIKSGVILPQDLDANAKTLHDVQPTPEVCSVINYYQNTFEMQDIYDALLKYSKLDQDKQRLYQMIHYAKAVENGSNPFVLSLAWDAEDKERQNAHAVVGYGLESGSWEINGETYDNRILVWDCNNPEDTENHSALYYQNSTLNWCMPAYGIHVNHDNATDNGRITFVCNSADILNAYPCPGLPTREPTSSNITLRGDVTADGMTDISDVILLARYTAEDTTVSVTPQGLLNADVNYDKRYTMEDVGIILRIIAKLET